MLGWDSLDKIRSRNKAISMYKILNDHTAPSLKSLFTLKNNIQSTHNLRSSATDLALPRPKTEYLRHTFSYSGAKLWNSLPYHIKEANSVISFKSAIALSTSDIS